MYENEFFPGPYRAVDFRITEPTQRSGWLGAFLDQLEEDITEWDITLDDGRE